jgi:hypothetical protein
MQKYPGIASHCRPSFDLLEERALLSGGYPGWHGPGQMPVSPPAHSGPMSSASPGFDGGEWSQNGWAQSPDGSWPSQRGGTTQSQPDWDGLSQPAGSPQYQIAAGPTIAFGFFAQVRLDSAPNLEIPSSTGSEPGSFAPAPVSGQPGTTSPEPAGPIPLDAQIAGNAGGVAGVTFNAGKDVGQAPGGVSNGPGSPAVNFPPAQLLYIWDTDSGFATRLVSQGEVSTAGIPLASNASGHGSVTATGHFGAANTGRGVLMPTVYVVTNLTDASDDDRPRPKSADLIASALPFDRAALDRAIDQFFQQFDELNHANPAGQMPAHIALYSLALASTFAALDVVLRRWRLTTTGKYMRVRHSLATEEHIGFPELPASWSSRLS